MSFIFTKYLFTCKDVTSHEDDTVSYHNVFESINSLDYEEEEVSFFLILALEYSIPKKGNRKVVLTLTDPEGQNIRKSDYLIELTPTAKDRIRFMLNVIKIHELNLNKEGIYTINVKHKGLIIARHEFFVERGNRDGANFNNELSVSL